MSSIVSVIDNALSDHIFDRLRDQLMSSPVWQYGVTLNAGESEYKSQMACVVYLNMYDGKEAICIDDNYEFVSKIIQMLKAKRLLRVKANLTLQTNKPLETGWHTDIDKEHVDMLEFIGLDSSKLMTAVLFMNSCNGYVEVEGEGKFHSVENRCVSFPVLSSHTGSTSSDSDHRMVVNIVYEAE